MRKSISSILATTFVAGTLTFAPLVAAQADEPPAPPQFIVDSLPEAAVDAAWKQLQAIYDPDGALDALSKEMVALAVAAQIPCQYCVHFHLEAARYHGATEAQIQEALAVGGLVRKWSMILQGHETDMESWRAYVSETFAAE